MAAKKGNFSNSNSNNSYYSWLWMDGATVSGESEGLLSTSTLLLHLLQMLLLSTSNYTSHKYNNTIIKEYWESTTLLTTLTPCSN